MAASANPAAEANNNNNEVVSSGGGGGLKHNPGISADWSGEEQSILEEALVKDDIIVSRYASDTPLYRYAKISKLLNDKTVRDVALRCRSMNKKESGKRRKDDMARKNKDKKEKTGDPSPKSSAHLAMRPNVSPYAPPMIPVDNDDGISYQAIGGPAGHLLEQNAKVFDQISSNFATLQVHENINLFCQTRDNILTIMNDLNDMPGIMKSMPPLPVKINEELANSILPRTARSVQS